jgi:hypothetical protein
MSVEIRFIPYTGNSAVHLGEGHSKIECLRLIGETEPEQKGVYEYIVHNHKITVYASTLDQAGVKKTLDRIFDN